MTLEALPPSLAPLAAGRGGAPPLLRPCGSAVSVASACAPVLAVGDGHLSLVSYV